MQAYDAYDFPAVPQALNAFVTVDLSAFYVDVSKDRLYTLAPKSTARRSAQTAMFIIVDGLARLVAPILPSQPTSCGGSCRASAKNRVHLAYFPQDLDSLVDAALVERWERLLRLREAVNVELERLRQAKVVGKSLEATRRAPPAGRHGRAARSGTARCLPTLFIVSDVTLTDGEAPDGAASFEESESSGVAIAVGRAEGVKCDRCWRYVPSVSQGPARAGLCDRCEQAVAEAHA